MKVKWFLLIVLVPTVAHGGTVLDFSRENTKSTLSITMFAQNRGNRYNTEGIQSYTPHSGTGVVDRYRLSLRDVESTHDIDHQSSATHLLWTGNDFEDFTFTWSINQEVKINVADYDTVLVPREPGGPGRDPDDGKHVDVHVDPLTITWQIDGPRSSVSGEYAYNFNIDQAGTQIAAMYDPPPREDYSWLQLSWVPRAWSGEQNQRVWMGELDGADIEWTSWASTSGKLTPEPSSAVLAVLGVAVIMTLRRNHLRPYLIK